MSDPLALDASTDTPAPKRPPARGLIGTTPPPAGSAGDAGFEQALRFVMNQESVAGRTLEQQLASGHGLTPIALAEYQRRHPHAVLPTDPVARNRAIYRDIWDASGAARMPRSLALVHYDASVNHGPTEARKMLAQSGGDPAAYVSLREQFYHQIPANAVEGGLARNPGWTQKRIPALRAAIGSSPVQPLLNRGSTGVSRATEGR